MMNQEETDEVVADEKSQEVDSRDEVMYTEKGSVIFSEQIEWANEQECMTTDEERALR